ncbi:MAG: rhomboid family intramembrane serine protease [Woeseiaceae bacterium]|nr:rhomboid family intramembrane serine protease [Woeseiaceae bacterium]
MIDDMRVVFESRNRRACADRSLVLAAANIPHRIIDDPVSCALVVPAEFSAEAANELRLYDEENPPQRQPRQAQPYQYLDAVPGIAAYIIAVVVFAWLSWTSAFGQDWLSAGRIDGVLVRAGEWWRAITALTMHSGLRHVAGNLVFGAFFGWLAGRLLGSGVAWAAVIVTAAAGNLLNTLLLESTHRSIGASTAVFAALGLTVGFVWAAKLMAQDRWAYRLGPIVGGLALLMYTGTGDENTDIGAHLMGFVSGFAGGILLTRFRDRLGDPKLQRSAGIVAFAMLVLAWITAFGG